MWFLWSSSRFGDIDTAPPTSVGVPVAVAPSLAYVSLSTLTARKEVATFEETRRAKSTAITATPVVSPLRKPRSRLKADAASASSRVEILPSPFASNLIREARERSGNCSMGMPTEPTFERRGASEPLRWSFMDGILWKRRGQVAYPTTRLQTHTKVRRREDRV